MAAQKKAKEKKTKSVSTEKPEIIKEEESTESSEKEKQKPQEEDSQVTATETEEASSQVEKSEPDDDISKYTIGSSGKAPAQDEKEKTQVKEGKTEKDTKGKEIVPMEIKNKKMYIVGIILSVLILGATAATLYFRFRQGTGVTEEVAVEVEEAQGEAEIEEQPLVTELLRSEISLEILNASGIAGLAGDTADSFEKLGYEIVKIGNAEDVTGNKLYVDPDIEESISVLLKDVEDELNISSISGELSDSTASARIILGE